MRLAPVAHIAPVTNASHLLLSLAPIAPRQLLLTATDHQLVELEWRVFMAWSLRRVSMASRRAGTQGQARRRPPPAALRRAAPYEALHNEEFAYKSGVIVVSC